MKTSSRVWILILLSSMAALLMKMCSPGAAAYTVDSLTYVSVADHLLSGRGFLSLNFGVVPVDKDVIPLELYPLGFPVMIALLGFCGFTLLDAAVFVPAVSFIALPWALFYLAKEILSEKQAFIVAILSSFMPITIWCGLMAWTDVPFLVLAVMSLKMMVKSFQPRSACWALTAGMLTGMSILMRSMGTALPLAMGVTLGLSGLFRLYAVKHIVKTGLSFTIGCGLALIMPVWRNVQLFSTPWPHADVTVGASWYDVSLEFLGVLTSFFIGDAQYRCIFLVLCLGLGMAVFVSLRNLCQHREKNKLKIISIILVGSYACIGSLALMYMITRYNYIIEERYILQYSWVLMTGFVFIFGYTFERLRLPDKTSRGFVSCLLCAAFFLVQVLPAADYALLIKGRERVYQTLQQRQAVLEEIPAADMLISNQPDLLHFVLNRPVRMLSGYTPFGLQKVAGEARSFTVVLFPAHMKKNRAWDMLSVNRSPYGYEVDFLDEDFIILSFTSPRAEPLNL